jgi:hypothetical protein
MYHVIVSACLKCVHPLVSSAHYNRRVHPLAVRKQTNRPKIEKKFYKKYA